MEKAPHPQAQSHQTGSQSRRGSHGHTKSRKGYWRMSANSIVQRALNNRWPKEQGVPELRSIWIRLHHGAEMKVKVQ